MIGGGWLYGPRSRIYGTFSDESEGKGLVPEKQSGAKRPLVSLSRFYSPPLAAGLFIQVASVS